MSAQLTESTSASAEQATLTFWIPERIDALLAAHERACSHTRSEALRTILRQYLYGLCGDPDAMPARPVPTANVSRGCWGGRMRGLGKNSIEAKLSLPRRWRDDLHALAADHGITLSHFAREVVATQLLGHSFLPPRMVTREGEASLPHRGDE